MEIVGQEVLLVTSKRKLYPTRLIVNPPHPTHVEDSTIDIAFVFEPIGMAVQSQSDCLGFGFTPPAPSLRDCIVTILASHVGLRRATASRVFRQFNVDVPVIKGQLSRLRVPQQPVTPM